MRTCVMQRDMDLYQSFSPQERKQSLHELGRKSAYYLLKREQVPYKQIINSSGSIDRGRPMVINEFGPIGSLSISHSNNLAASVFSKEYQVGIDIEQITSRSPAFYKYSFTKKEQELIGSDPTKADFISTLLWTAKESVLKAEGIGLSVPATRVESLISFQICQDFFQKKIKTISFMATYSGADNGLRRKYFLTSKQVNNYILTVARV